MRQPAGGWRGSAVGSSNPPLSLQVTQFQQVYTDWRQCLHRTVSPAVPVRGKERGIGKWKGGGLRGRGSEEGWGEVRG